MAIRIAMNVVCDRCMKPYQQRTLEYGEKVPEVKRDNLVVLRESEPDEAGEVKQDILFTCKDLCPSCQKVVDKAIQRLKMEPAPKKKKKKRNGVRTTVKPEETAPEAEAAPEAAKEEAAEPELPPETSEDLPPPEDKAEDEEEEPLF